MFGIPMIFLLVCCLSSCSISVADAEDITTNSEALWRASNWNEAGESFTSCDELKDNDEFCLRKSYANTRSDPFINSFRTLLDIYDPANKGELNKADETGQEKRKEEQKAITAFLTAFTSIRIGREYLVMHNGGHPVDDARREAIETELHDMWFGTSVMAHGQPLNRKIGFRHVFVGEKGKKKMLSGFHNWFQYYRLACPRPRPRHPSFRMTLLQLAKPIGVHLQLCKIKIQWDLNENTHEKEESTILFGSQPEYDFAVFSLCFKKLRGTTPSKVKETCGASIAEEPLNILAIGNTDRKPIDSATQDSVTQDSEIHTVYFNG